MSRGPGRSLTRRDAASSPSYQRKGARRETAMDTDEEPRWGRFRRPSNSIPPEWEVTPSVSEEFASAGEADTSIIEGSLGLPQTARESTIPKITAQGEASTLLPPMNNAFLHRPQGLWEIIPPEKNLAGLSVAEQSLFATLSQVPERTPGWLRGWHRKLRPGHRQQDMLALEVAGSSGQARLFLRGSLPLLANMFEHLLASYRQVERRVIDQETTPEEDPLTLRTGEEVNFAELYLEAPAALPLKLPEAQTLVGGGDPFVGVLCACACTVIHLPPSVRLVSQLLINPAPIRWGQRYRRLLERRRKQPGGTGRSQPTRNLAELGLVGLLLVGFLVYSMVSHGLLSLLIGLVFALLTLSGLLLVRLGKRWRLTRRLLRYEQEVAGKLNQRVVQTRLRLYVLGPAEEAQAREAALDQLIGAYGAYAGPNRWQVGRRGQFGAVQSAIWSLATQQNSSQERALRKQIERYQAMRDPSFAFQPGSWWERLVLRTGGDRLRPVLGINEVGALWHLPALDAPLSYLETVHQAPAFEESHQPRPSTRRQPSFLPTRAAISSDGPPRNARKRLNQGKRKFD